MNAQKELLVTQEGYNAMQEKLDYLKQTKRHEVSERIKVAREFGDLSENAEYDEAKNEQAFVEGEIQDLMEKLKIAIIVDDTHIDNSVVHIGNIVKIYDVEFDEELEFKIVGATEADPVNHKISNESPVGAGLLGKKSGDTVLITVPDGDIEYKILEITK
jgi:transcription elongation factor GreA